MEPKLRRVRPGDVRIGMFVHGFEGPWKSHPFWRSKFVVDTPELLARLRASSVPAVLVDDARGHAVAPAAAPAPRPDDRTAASAPPSFPPAPTPTPAFTSTPAPSPTPPSGDGPLPDGPLMLAGIAVAPARAEDADRIVVRSRQVMRQVLGGLREGQAIPWRDVVGVVASVSAAVSRNRSMLIGITRLKNKDDYTYMHSVAVCALMIALGREMGMADEAVAELGLAGLVHDIGKATVPEAILNKASPLSASEMALLRQHPAKGHAMLAREPDVPATVREVCLQHHERLNGLGYPAGLSGDQLGTAVRMAMICDVYDAMTSVRPYRIAVTPADAVTAMIGMGAELDQALLFRFMQTVGVFPTGMLVRLRSEKLAVVLSNGGRTARPRVRAFHCTATRTPLRPHDLILLDREDGDRIVARERPEAWGLADWSGRRDQLLAGG